jgi:hypothetical protein
VPEFLRGVVTFGGACARVALVSAQHTRTRTLAAIR